MTPPNNDLNQQRLADAWTTLQNASLNGDRLQPDAYRLAFADPEFLLRRETRGVRMQLELLKPDLAQTAAHIEHTVVVYGSARTLSPEAAQSALEAAKVSQDPVALAMAERQVKNSVYYAQARELGQLVSRYTQQCPTHERLYICTGGGPGIMEAANRGAHDIGVKSVALNIALPHEQSANAYVTPELSFKFHYFGLRKMHFMMRAKALVVFPGGFGTMDELFETLTLIQTGKATTAPVVMVGSNFWNKVLNLQVLADEGLISPQDLKLFTIVDTPQAAWDVIREFYGLNDDCED